MLLDDDTFDNADDNDDHDDDIWDDLFNIRVYQRASESLSHQYPAPHWVYHQTFCDDYIDEDNEYEDFFKSNGIYCSHDF